MLYCKDCSKARRIVFVRISITIKLWEIYAYLKGELGGGMELCISQCIIVASAVRLIFGRIYANRG